MAKNVSLSEMTPGKKFFFTRIFPFIFVAAGVVMTFIGLNHLIKARASVNWPTAEGKITSSSVERHRSSDNDDRTRYTYHAEIGYRFMVDGRTYHGSRVAYGDYGSSNSSHARRIVGRYPEGKVITVHYMPDSPGECLLEAGLKAQSFFLPVFGLVFLGVGIFMAVALPGAARQEGAGPSMTVNNDSS